MLDSALLEKWIATFYGYGSWSSPYWFIGLEEGGVNSEAEFAGRLRAWSDAGSPDLLDLRTFHEAIGVDHFSGRPPLQRTWRPLMRTLFAAEGREISKEALRAYQANQLGSRNGETALLELSPLPAKSTAERWFRDHELLANVDVYALTRERRDRLTAMIEQHKPRAVVTYGDMKSWQKHFSLLDTGAPFQAGRYASSIVVASSQLRGAPSNEHWDEIGKYIRNALAA